MKDGKLGVAMMGPGRIVHRVMQTSAMQRTVS